MPKKIKTSKRLKELQEQLNEAEKSNQQKELELKGFQQAVKDAREQVAELKNDNTCTSQLEQTVQQLLTRQRETTQEYNDYENRVLILELQSLVDRYRMMDVEHLEEDNHKLRGEVFRLQAENMQLSRAVSETSMQTRRDVARIEIAMEGTVRERLLSARKTMMEQLTSQLDVKTRMLLTNHGELQEAMISLADQVTVLDDKYRTLSMQRRQFKVDSELGDSMSKLQAKQLVVLRHQLDHSFLVNSDQKAQLEREEARAERAEAEAMQANSLAFKLTRDLERMRGLGVARQGMHEDDSDSAFGLAGEEFETEVTALNRQLGHVRDRQERVVQQRDHWRDRCLLYERACSQLQASLHALQGSVQLSLPNGKAQPLESVWCTKSDGSKPQQGAGPGSGKVFLGLCKQPLIAAAGSLEGQAAAADGEQGSNVEGVTASRTHAAEGCDAHGKQQRAGGERCGAVGGWLSGNAVRAQSARMRCAGVGVGFAGRPTSAAPGLSLSTHAGSRTTEFGGSVASHSKSGLIEQGGSSGSGMRPGAARPASAAAVPSPSSKRPFGATPTPGKGGPAIALPRSGSLASTSSSAVGWLSPYTKGRPASAAVAQIQGATSSASHTRPGSAVAGTGSVTGGELQRRRGRGWKLSRMNAAQVGWLSGLQPGWMGNRGTQQLSLQLEQAGIPVQSDGNPWAAQPGGMLVTQGVGEEDTIGSGKGQLTEVLAQGSGAGQQMDQQHQQQRQQEQLGKRPAFREQQQQQLQPQPGLRDAQIAGSAIWEEEGRETIRVGGGVHDFSAAIEEEGELAENAVQDDDGGDSEELEDVPWDSNRVRHQPLQQQQQQQGEDGPWDQRNIGQQQQHWQQQWLSDQPEKQATAQQPKSPPQRPASHASVGLTAPSRLYSNDPEPFQVLYPNLAGTARGVRVLRPKAAAPALSAAPMVLHRKHAGSLRYFTDPYSSTSGLQSPRHSNPTLPTQQPLIQQQQPQQEGEGGECDPAGHDSIGLVSAPSAAQEVVAALRQAYARTKQAHTHDASILFASRQTGHKTKPGKGR